jgi:hypothetical protein
MKQSKCALVITILAMISKMSNTSCSASDFLKVLISGGQSLEK